MLVQRWLEFHYIRWSWFWILFAFPCSSQFFQKIENTENYWSLLYSQDILRKNDDDENCDIDDETEPIVGRPPNVMDDEEHELFKQLKTQ